MKKPSEFKNLLEQTKKKEKIKKEKVDIKWIITIVLIAFVISFGLYATPPITSTKSNRLTYLHPTGRLKFFISH